jgi:hypothetical protein
VLKRDIGNLSGRGINLIEAPGLNGNTCTALKYPSFRGSTRAASFAVSIRATGSSASFAPFLLPLAGVQDGGTCSGRGRSSANNGELGSGRDIRVVADLWRFEGGAPAGRKDANKQQGSREVAHTQARNFGYRPVHCPTSFDQLMALT